MKKNFVIFILVVLTIINVTALGTIAYHRFHPKRPLRPMGRPDVPINLLKQELGLNEEQAKEFESHMERFRTETEPILDSIRAKRKDLMDEIAAEEPNMDKLERLSEEIGSLQVSLQKKTIMHMLEGRSLLSLKQQKKLFSLFKEGRDRIRGFRDPERGIGEQPGHPDFEKGE